MALVFAARFAQQCDAALHVLHVQDPLLGIAAQHEGFDLVRDTDDALTRFIESAWPAADCSPRRHTATGVARESILATAYRVDAQLVVIGARGMSRVEHLVFGSTTEGVLRGGGVSVGVVPTGWAPQSPDARDLSGVGPVVAGVDLSDPSAAAAKAGCALASMLGTSLVLVSVVPKLTVLSGWDAFAQRAVHDRVATVRQALQALVEGLGCSIPVEMRVEVGQVAAELAAAAAPTRDRMPVLVLGRASGGIGNAPGAIAYRVLSGTNVPVVIHIPTAQPA